MRFPVSVSASIKGRQLKRKTLTKLLKFCSTHFLGGFRRNSEELLLFRWLLSSGASNLFPRSKFQGKCHKAKHRSAATKRWSVFWGWLSSPSKWDNSSGAIKSKVHGNHITSYDMFSKASVWFLTLVTGKKFPPAKIVRSNLSLPEDSTTRIRC